MIEQFHPEGSPYVDICNHASQEPLTIQKNSVILLRVSFNDYDVEEMNTLQEYYQKTFPNNKVVVMFDNIKIDVIHDKSYRKVRPCADISYETQNYY